MFWVPSLLLCIVVTDENTTMISSLYPENIHPLTVPETDVYDNANSLQVITNNYYLEFIDLEK